MAALKVSWTQTAIRQRNLVFEYWNERNQSYMYSRKLYSKINERLEILKQNPEIRKVTVYANTRVVSLGHYSIFYKVQSPVIYITGFWDNRQEPARLKKYWERRTSKKTIQPFFFNLKLRTSDLRPIFNISHHTHLSCPVSAFCNVTQTPIVKN
jgi:hypothetical protein